MEQIKRALVESGVIGGVVDEFNPHIYIDVIYGVKEINLGTEVSPAEVENKPCGFRLHYDPHHYEFRDPDHSEFLGTPSNPKLITVVMTDPDAPGGEYLHWLTAHFIAVPQDLDLPWRELVGYEAPRRRGTRMIVFTVFRTNESRPNMIVPQARENFNTRAFAETNALGPPMAAAFFRIND